MAGECGPPAGVGARVRMIRMPALPNTAPAGCDFDAELLAGAGARRGGQPHVASAVSRAVSAGQRELVERHGVDLDNGLAGLRTVVDEIGRPPLSELPTGCSPRYRAPTTTFLPRVGPDVAGSEVPRWTHRRRGWGRCAPAGSRLLIADGSDFE
jgi:hypothetical protein